jgi:valyl-tRNA synthetase
VSNVAPGGDTSLSDAKLENARNFANKLWNIGRFVLRQLETYPDALGGAAIDASPARADLREADRWILSRTESAVADATSLIEAYQFGEYASFMQQFVWSELADAYVELSKAGLRDEARRAGTVHTLAYVLDRVLRLLHPHMPFITETLALQLWRHGRTLRDDTSLVIARWPEPGPRDAGLEARFGLALEVVAAIRSLRQDAGVAPGERVRAMLSGDTKAVAGSVDAIASLANADVTLGQGEGPAAVVRTVDVRIAATRDAAAERARLERDLAEAREQLRRSEELLGRESFAAKAPPAVVAKERARLAERRERIRLLEEELRRLR